MIKEKKLIFTQISTIVRLPRMKISAKISLYNRSAGVMIALSRIPLCLVVTFADEGVLGQDQGNNQT
jgi:hypothetical protein